MSSVRILTIGFHEPLTHILTAWGFKWLLIINLGLEVCQWRIFLRVRYIHASSPPPTCYNTDLLPKLKKSMGALISARRQAAETRYAILEGSLFIMEHISVLLWPFKEEIGISYIRSALQVSVFFWSSQCRSEKFFNPQWLATSGQDVRGDVLELISECFTCSE